MAAGVRAVGDTGEHTVDQELVHLMTEHEAALQGFLGVLVGNRAAALDCTQDTFLRAYEQLRRGRPVTRAWLYTVARNRGIDEIRRRKRLIEDTDLTRFSGPHTDEGAAAVRQAMAQLSAEDREVLHLFAVDGFSTESIAGMLGIRAGAVRVRLHRARQRFRQIYGDAP